MTDKQNRKVVSCLITGFGPFGDVQKNPSQLIADAMAGSPITGEGCTIEVETLVLPTSRKDSWKLLKRKLDRKRPGMLIMLGVAAGRTQVSLERFALNIRDYQIVDVSGNKPVGKPIRKNGPSAYKSNLPLVELEKTLRSKKLKCEISNHAGTFVCNDLYYRALHYQSKTGGPGIVQFVHVPALKAKIDETKQIKQFSKTIAELVRLCAQ